MLISTHAMHATLEAPYVPVQWTQVVDSPFETSNIYSVTSNTLNRYVAVGALGKVGLSLNGVDWSLQNAGFESSNIYASGHGDNRYIIGGTFGKMAVSFDGSSWVQVPSSFGASTILSVDYFEAQNIWIAVGGSGKLATSVDGYSWTQRLSSFGTSFINNVYTIGGLAIAVGYDGKLATSTNGISWTQRTSSFFLSTINSVSSDPQAPYRYIASGDDGKIAYSDNGTSWTQVFPSTTFSASSIKTVAATEEVFVAAGSLGKLATSPDREGWTQRVSSFGSDTINDIYIQNQFAVAVGNSGKIAYST